MEDKIFIRPGSVSGRIEAYPSKSYIQRAFALGLLNTNGLTISNYKDSSDSLAVLESVIRLGAEVKKTGTSLSMKGTDMFKSNHINCGESGLCLRMFAPLMALSDREFIINGSEQLLKRGNEYISDTLLQVGVKCTLFNDHMKVKGPLRGGEINIDYPTGSQLITGLMFALSKTKGDSLIRIKNPVSSPYIMMTARLLNDFGAAIDIHSGNEIYVKGMRDFKSGSIKIEGDWSSTAFFLVAAAVSGEVTVSGLNHESLQPDATVIDYLKRAGASVTLCEEGIKVSKQPLKSFDADIKEHPDLFIPLVVLAINCEGISRIYNYERLRFKESDRPAAIIRELSNLGASIKIVSDHIKIEKSRLNFGELDTYNDHRLAMGFTAAALNSDSGLMIKNKQCVNKSYPNFFNEFDSIFREKKL